MHETGCQVDKTGAVVGPERKFGRWLAVRDKVGIRKQMEVIDDFVGCAVNVRVEPDKAKVMLERAEARRDGLGLHNDKPTVLFKCALELAVEHVEGDIMYGAVYT